MASGHLSTAHSFNGGWKILFHMQAEGGKLPKKLKLGSLICPCWAEETFFTTVLILPGAILILTINQSYYPTHNSRFYSDYKKERCTECR